jgi:DNA-binding PadR family transcriptional regulator
MYGYHGHGHHHGSWQWAAGRHGGRHGFGKRGNWDLGGRDPEDWMRAKRMLAQGDLRLIALALIAEAPRHGYEIIKLLEEKTGDWYSPSPGIIYPTLTLLEELGYARIAAETGGRKLYSITDEGTAFLAANRSAVDTVMARMAEISQAYGGGPAPEIRRAMQNLETALAIRLGRGPLAAEQVRAVTVILDRAAGEIEQS